MTLLSVYCHASPALSAGLLQELMKYGCALERFRGKQKKKGTKETMCIRYSLSGVVLTLQTPRDGFVVNVKRAGAAD